MDNKYLVPEDEREKLEEILDEHDHDVYVDKEEMDLYFDKLKLVFWEKCFTNESPCVFCGDITEYINIINNMFACSACYVDLENKEIDICHPGDHVLSNKLRTVLCEWADLNHYCECSSEDFFGFCGMTHNICYICHNIIESNSDNVALATSARAIGHPKCVAQYGFRNHYTDTEYNDIFETQVSEYIKDLNNDPDFCHKKSSKVYPDRLVNDGISK